MVIEWRRRYGSQIQLKHELWAHVFCRFFCNDKGVPRQEIILVVSGRGTESWWKTHRFCFGILNSSSPLPFHHTEAIYRPVSSTSRYRSRWWFQIFLEFLPRSLGKSSNLTVAYFSIGLVQPPTRDTDVFLLLLGTSCLDFNRWKNHPKTPGPVRLCVEGLWILCVRCCLDMGDATWMSRWKLGSMARKWVITYL